MNYLEEMFVALVLVLVAFFILIRLAQIMLRVSLKLKLINAKSALAVLASWGD